MNPEDDEVALAAAEEDAFASGYVDKPVEKAKRPAAEAAAKPVEKPVEKTVEAVKPEAEKTKAVVEPPKYVQISEKEWAEVRASAAKTASYDAQLSKAFGTIGQLQKVVNESRAKPAEAPPASPRKIEISKDAYAEMAADFPELAEMSRSALEKALSGMVGPSGEIDPDKLEAWATARDGKRELAALVDDYPDWREIVGAVDITKEQPPEGNAFRAWLATQDAAYQERLNSTQSAAVIGKAIAAFQRHAKTVADAAMVAADAAADAAAKAKVPVVKATVMPTPKEIARNERVRDAVQPRGDGGTAAGAKTEQDAFEEGFNSR